jgi:hypothetical protein
MSAGRNLKRRRKIGVDSGDRFFSDNKEHFLLSKNYDGINFEKIFFWGVNQRFIMPKNIS